MGFCWLSLVTKYYCGMSCISDVHPYGRELYVSCFSYLDFRKQSGPVFQVISQCINKASRKIATSNRKEPAELKLEEFCAVCEEQIFWQTARRVYSANITEVYAWSYLYINSWCSGLMPYSIVS